MRVVEEKSVKEFFMKYPATTTILVVTILLHLATYVVGNGPTDYETARKFGALLSANKSFTELPFLLTSTYQHIGGMLHLLMNMAFIVISAPYLEELFGSIRFVILYNLTGIAGSFVTLLFMDEAISSGASSAGYGMMGIYLTLIILKKNGISSEIKQTVLAMFIIGIVMTFAVPGISITGHLGGLFAGMILGSIVPTSRKKYSPAKGVAWALLIPVMLLILLYIPQKTLDEGQAQNLFSNEFKAFNQPFVSKSPSGDAWLAERYKDDIYKQSVALIQLYGASVTGQSATYQQEVATILRTIQQNQQDAALSTIDVPRERKEELMQLYAQLEQAATVLQAGLPTMDYILLNQYVAINDQLVADCEIFLEKLN